MASTIPRLPNVPPRGGGAEGGSAPPAVVAHKPRHTPQLPLAALREQPQTTGVGAAAANVPPPALSIVSSTVPKLAPHEGKGRQKQQLHLAVEGSGVQPAGSKTVTPLPSTTAAADADSQQHPRARKGSSGVGEKDGASSSNVPHGHPARRTPAVSEVHDILSVQQNVLRQIFRDIDSKYIGSAPREALSAAIMRRLSLPSTFKTGLEQILDVADPKKVGIIEFGRLMRLVRSELGPNQTFIVKDDDEDELRQRFTTVVIADRQLLRRLKHQRHMSTLPTGARTSNILGDSHLRAPWAIAGDDERVSHIFSNMQAESFVDLRAALYACTTPSAPDVLNYDQLLTALRRFDPLVHEAEVIQYFKALISARNVRTAVISEKCGPIGASETISPRRRYMTVSIADFLHRFASTVLSSPAMRCSATFTLKWQMPESLPLPKQGPQPATTKRGGARKSMKTTTGMNTARPSAAKSSKLSPTSPSSKPWAPPITARH